MHAETPTDPLDNVNNSGQTRTSAYLTGMSATRKEVAIVKSMQRDVKHTRVVIEGLLSAVAMVNILENDGMKGQDFISHKNDQTSTFFASDMIYK